MHYLLESHLYQCSNKIGTRLKNEVQSEYLVVLGEVIVRDCDGG